MTSSLQMTDHFVVAVAEVITEEAAYPGHRSVATIIQLASSLHE